MTVSKIIEIIKIRKKRKMSYQYDIAILFWLNIHYTLFNINSNMQGHTDRTFFSYPFKFQCVPEILLDASFQKLLKN